MSDLTDEQRVLSDAIDRLARPIAEKFDGMSSNLTVSVLIAVNLMILDSFKLKPGASVLDLFNEEFVPAMRSYLEKVMVHNKAEAADVETDVAPVKPQKPHMGEICDWYREPSLHGYIIRGRFVDHPFFAGDSGHTSFVLNERKPVVNTLLERKETEIETMDYCFTLLGNPIQDLGVTPVLKTDKDTP